MKNNQQQKILDGFQICRKSILRLVLVFHWDRGQLLKGFFFLVIVLWFFKHPLCYIWAIFLQDYLHLAKVFSQNTKGVTRCSVLGTLTWLKSNVHKHLDVAEMDHGKATTGVQNSCMHENIFIVRWNLMTVYHKILSECTKKNSNSNVDVNTWYSLSWYCTASLCTQPESEDCGPNPLLSHSPNAWIHTLLASTRLTELAQTPDSAGSDLGEIEVKSCAWQLHDRNVLLFWNMSDRLLRRLTFCFPVVEHKVDVCRRLSSHGEHSPRRRRMTGDSRKALEWFWLIGLEEYWCIGVRWVVKVEVMSVAMLRTGSTIRTRNGDAGWCTKSLNCRTGSEDFSLKALKVCKHVTGW